MVGYISYSCICHNLSTHRSSINYFKQLYRSRRLWKWKSFGCILDSSSTNRQPKTLLNNFFFCFFKPKKTRANWLLHPWFPLVWRSQHLRVTHLFSSLAPAGLKLGTTLFGFIFPIISRTLKKKSLPRYLSLRFIWLCIHSILHDSFLWNWP